MKTISKRELNQQTAQVLATVTPEDPLLVTERGVVRWRIEAVGSSDPVERLYAQGRLIPASKNPKPWPEKDDQPLYTSAQIDALYHELRGEW